MGCDYTMRDYISDFIAGMERVIEAEERALAAAHAADAAQWMGWVAMYCGNCPDNGRCRPVIVEAAFQVGGRPQ